MVEYLDLLCSITSPDIIPLLSQGDDFLDALEISLLSFLRHGSMAHVLGLQPYAFVQFNRAVLLLEGLLSKKWARVT